MTMTMTISRSPPEGFPGSGCPPLTTARAVGLAAFGSRSRRLSFGLAIDSMAIKTARSTVGWQQNSAAHYKAPTSRRRVCTFWLAGKCNRNPCRFSHDASLPGNVYHRAAKQSSHMAEDCPGRKGPESSPGVSGIAFPSGSTKLYSGSKDGTARIWDCHTGQCDQVINLGGEVGCFTCEGPWVFVGLPHTVKAYNIQNGASYNISGPVGQVHALEVANDMLFAGAQDGTILVWKGGSEADPFQMALPLRGHTQGVVSLTVGRNRLYSGSIDQTIRVWDLHTLECVQELVGHTDVVMSLLCWDQYLISCSLDATIKIWGVATEGGSLEVGYTHHEDHGILALSGTIDTRGKPVLLCACLDNTVRLYELPSFTERGKIFSRREVRTLQTAPGGLFFTGDAAGTLTVWNWLDRPKSQKEQLPQPMEFKFRKEDNVIYATMQLGL
ncbi:zinc finger CCCH domain-containing protein 48-like [Eucalyptus grandis]|uniref:zinc finger CCCH domain-containing protein 48-like n=1 Tax=Eucalyptus grandis TaxID=71139 RepID=UPI00192EBEBA|nr:zinc finger CCCH domain-containing protein 48-like [Eucalyptus grandis]